MSHSQLKKKKTTQQILQEFIEEKKISQKDKVAKSNDRVNYFIVICQMRLINK